jgi:simple sugar transport system substrate-binding protein
VSRLDRAGLLRRLAAAGAAASLADAAPARAADGPFPGHPRWKLVFVSHQTTNPLFVPTQYGIQDACDLVGCTYEWTGSATGDVREMARALNGAIATKAGGIAVAVVDEQAFAAPIERALGAQIPVVAFSLGSAGPRRVAFVGQNPYDAGLKAGERIVRLVGRGKIVVFTPGSPAAARRFEGVAAAVERSGAPVTLTRVPLGAEPLRQADEIDAYVLANRGPRGWLATDLTSTDGLGRAIRRRGLRTKAGGYGVLPATLKLIDDGRLDFTIDEEPYLQGFMPAIQLFLARLSGRLVEPVDVNTGLRFVTKANVRPFLTTKSRFEGSSSKRRYPLA